MLGFDLFSTQYGIYFVQYIPADLVKYCSMQIIMGAWSYGLGFSVTHHRLDSCVYPGIVTFILELFS